MINRNSLSIVFSCLLLLILFCSLPAVAQTSKGELGIKAKQKINTSTSNWLTTEFTSSNHKESGESIDTILWADFEAGMPAGWTQTTLATDGGWLPGDAGTLSSQYWSIPTHTNILATNDDGCDCDKSVDNLMTPVLDFSTYSFLFMRFETYYRGLTYQGRTEEAHIRVSTDGGATWDTIFTLPGFLQWETYILDLSSYAGQPNVIISFFYYDALEWLYGWAIDDLIIGVPPKFEPELNVVGLTDNYSMIPLPQATNFTFKGKIRNNGSNVILNVTVDVSINPGGFSDQTVLTNVPGLSIVSFNTTTPYKASSTGGYTATVTVSSDSLDSDTTNNELSVQFSVNDSIYAYDNDANNGDLGGMNPALSAFRNIVYGQVFTLYEEDTITSIACKLENGFVGGTYRGALYFTDGNGIPVKEIPNTETMELEIGNSSPKWHTVRFKNGPMILPKGTYMVGFKEPKGNQAMGMQYTSDDFVAGSSFIHVDGFGWSTSEDFWNGDFIYLIRAHFGNAGKVGTSIEDQTTFDIDPLISIYPNPSSGSFTIVSDETIELVEIFDLTGQTLFKRESQPNAGHYDLTGIGTGLYLVRIETENHTCFRKLVIN
ncbi:MAG: T9SS type A sorting domain-containing protein [Bacteroidetes bacterium]|nr:T9SS type A sorting domain-containing protein [Bacteroidota bacterium]